MGQGDSRWMTHVANCYHEDIRACVKANRIEVYEGMTASTANISADGLVPGLDIKAGASHATHEKRKYVTQDPGFATIKPGGYFGFAESGPDGHVFVTIQIGEEIPHANVQVYNDSNVLVDEEGSLRNVKYKEIWTDTSGQKHTVATPAKDTKVEKVSKKKSEKKDKGSRKASDANEDVKGAVEEEHEFEENPEQWEREFKFVDTKLLSSAKGLIKSRHQDEGKQQKKSKESGKGGKDSHNDSDDTGDAQTADESISEQFQVQISVGGTKFASLAKRLMEERNKAKKKSEEEKKKAEVNGKDKSK